MTQKEQYLLRHNKYIAYMQILAGFVISLMAAQIFNVFEIKSTLFNGAIHLTNYGVGGIIGLGGLYFMRKRLKEIEAIVGEEK